MQLTCILILSQKLAEPGLRWPVWYSHGRRGARALGPVRLYALRTTEIDLPAGVRPLALTPLTSVPTQSPAEAQERIQW